MTDQNISFSISPSYMPEALRDVTPENIRSWLERATTLPARTFEGYQIRDSIDGDSQSMQREVSLVSVQGPATLDEHCHINSDTLFIITQGAGTLTSDGKPFPVKEGDKIASPHGKPHGFIVEPGQTLELIAVQSPPIRHRHTGVEDFHNAKHVDRLPPRTGRRIE